jgi:hypothetical protein
MDEKKRFTARLELSRREGEVVGGFAENWLAWHNLHETDARQKIFAEVVKHRFGEYTIHGESQTKEPMWNKVFEKNLCPESNTDEMILSGKDPHVLEEDGLNLLCRHCGFTVTKALWEEGRKSNEAEKKIREKDKEFSEKISKYNIPKEHLDELARKGIMEVQRAVRTAVASEQEQHTPPSEV